MASPLISGIETLVQRIASHMKDESLTQQTDGSLDTTTGHQELRFDCFNRLDGPRGHYFSVPELYARGVWVGYL